MYDDKHILGLHFFHLNYMALATSQRLRGNKMLIRPTPRRRHEFPPVAWRNPSFWLQELECCGFDRADHWQTFAGATNGARVIASPR